MTPLSSATTRILMLGATIALAGCSQGGRFSLNLPGGGGSSPSSTPPTLNDPGRRPPDSRQRTSPRRPSDRRVVQSAHASHAPNTPRVGTSPRPDTVSFADRREATSTSSAALVGVFGELTGRPVARRAASRRYGHRDH